MLLQYVAVMKALRFRTQANGLDAILGELERPIMEAVWAGGEVSVTAVSASLSGNPAYTTVKTVMERLERKGLLTRARQGRAFMYRAAMGRDALQGAASRQVIEGLMSAFGSAALTQFAQVVREDPARLRELRDLLNSLPDDDLPGGGR